jgi:hypothetical protein
VKISSYRFLNAGELMDNKDIIWIWMLSTCLIAAATGFCLMAET